MIRGICSSQGLWGAHLLKDNSLLLSTSKKDIALHLSSIDPARSSVDDDMVTHRRLSGDTNKTKCIAYFSAHSAKRKFLSNYRKSLVHRPLLLNNLTPIDISGLLEAYFRKHHE